ncbi:HAD family hydrolase [Blautia sp. HCP28S3_G10]|uniref:HAD family hydrolase n=1 Tax=Blautia sp. HCP28S3_G10 TaxID=3438908 RepID=UPI003F8C9E93
MDSIIFDVDGTLWNSTEITARAWTEYLQETEHMNITITSDQLVSMFGQPLPDIASQIFPERTKAEQLRLIDECCQAEHRALLKKCAPLYPELEKTLSILSSRYPLYIVSNSQAGYIEVFLETTGFGKYFRDHLCNGDNGLDKGSNISLIASRNNLKDPVYVGDTYGDFLACRQADVPFVFASYGFGKVPEPDAIIASPIDLTALSL